MQNHKHIKTTIKNSIYHMNSTGYQPKAILQQLIRTFPNPMHSRLVNYFY